MNGFSDNMTPYNSDTLLGSWRRFGADGIVYQVTALKDDKNVAIKVLDTGEELAYPVKQATSDPLA